MMTTVSPRRALTVLRWVLIAYGIGHLFTATEFVLWPGWFIDRSGSRPPWPLELVQFGDWPPLHQGFMNVIAAYDVAVAVALFIAAANPVRHAGILVFASVLWVLHGGAHAYHIIWGSSPSGYWTVVAELWLGAALIAVLYRLATRSKAGAGAVAVEASP